MSERHKKLQELKHKFKTAQDEISLKRCCIDGCSNSPIKAHTIQENGALRHLVGLGENNAEGVYYLDDRIEYDFKSLKITSIQAINRVDFKAISLASTFYGFCKEHDEIFNKEIENVDYDSSDRMNFYHTFRTHAFSLHKEAETFEFLNQRLLTDLLVFPNNIDNVKGKISELNPHLDKLPDTLVLTEEQINLFKKNFQNLAVSDFNSDGKIKENMKIFLAEFFTKTIITGRDVKELLKKGDDFLTSSPAVKQLDVLIEKFSEAIPPAMLGIKLLRNRFSHLFENKTYNEFQYFSQSVPGIFPISGAFVAGYLDYIAAPYSDGNIVMPKYALTFFPEPSLLRTTFIIGTFKENPNVGLFFSRLRIMEIDSFKKFISNLILLRGTNTYFSPRFWRRIADEERNIILKRKELKKDTDFGLYDLGLNLFDQKYADQ